MNQFDFIVRKTIEFCSSAARQRSKYILAAPFHRETFPVKRWFIFIETRAKITRDCRESDCVLFHFLHAIYDNYVNLSLMPSYCRLTPTKEEKIKFNKRLRHAIRIVLNRSNSRRICLFRSSPPQFMRSGHHSSAYRYETKWTEAWDVWHFLPSVPTFRIPNLIKINYAPSRD